LKGFLRVQLPWLARFSLVLHLRTLTDVVYTLSTPEIQYTMRVSPASSGLQQVALISGLQYVHLAFNEDYSVTLIEKRLQVETIGLQAFRTQMTDIERRSKESGLALVLVAPDMIRLEVGGRVSLKAEAAAWMVQEAGGCQWVLKNGGRDESQVIEYGCDEAVLWV
jgi:hypothetical protein